MRRNKKGFTIVELVIVIAVIGVLAAVLIPTFMNLTNKANQAADDSLVKNLNTALATQEGVPGDVKNNTLHDAVVELEDYGYKLPNLITKSHENTLLWNSKTNRFLLEKDLDADKSQNSSKNMKNVDYFHIQDNLDGDKGYSIYAGNGFSTSNPVNLTKGQGFDAGFKTFETISYTRAYDSATDGTDAHNVIIRTNSYTTSLSITAANDTVSHYGTVGALNIASIKTDSYHENGKVAYVEIARGRIVLESGSKIEEIHVNKMEDQQAFDTVIIANNGGAEELPERITRDAVTVESETLVVTVESNGSSEQVYVYGSGSTGTTEKTTTQNAEVESALGQLVLDNGSEPGQKAKTEEQKEAEKTEVVNTAIESTEFEGVAIVKVGYPTQLMTLEDFRDRVNAGNSYEGYIVKLLDDIDLREVNWTPIGTSEHPFSGTFDGQDYKISNYKITGGGANVGLGLFGYIEGLNNSTVATFTKDTPLSSFYDNSTYTVTLPDEKVFTCAIKNLKVSDVDVNTTADGWTAAVVANVKNATVSNVRLSKSKVVANCKVGGIVGALSANYCCFITNCTTTSDVQITARTENHCAGILSRVIDPGHAIVANCTNNATINCAGVNGSGIAGQSKGTLFYNNTNNGAITGGKRVAGIATDTCTSVFIGCTNKGYIKATNAISGSADSIAGIASYFSSTGHNVIVDCQNSGTVEGTTSGEAAKIAGIVAGGLTTSDLIINNSNTGTLKNNATGGKVYDICDISSVAYEIEPANLSELNTRLATDNKYIKVTNSITLSDSDVVVVNNQEKLEFVNSPSYLTVNLTDSNASSFVIVVNDTTVKLINGTGKIVTVSGKGNTVIVEEGQGIQSLRVSNDDKSVASMLNLEGSADRILFSGDGLINGEVKLGATAGRAIFGGTGTFVLTNRGTISHETTTEFGVEHTIDSINPCDITIYNYGTIAARKNANDICSYALLFYGGVNVKFYAYNGSMLRQDLHSVMAINGETTVAIYYEEGAGLNDYGNDYTYPQLFDYGDSHITVTEI